MSLSPESSSDPQIKPLQLSIGATSPLWMLFAGAAATGAAYWWLKQISRPVNLEAMMGAKGVAQPELGPMDEPALATGAVAYEPAPVVEAVGAAAPQPVEEPTPAMVTAEEPAHTLIVEPDSGQAAEAAVGAAAPQPMEEPAEPSPRKPRAARAPLPPPDA